MLRLLCAMTSVLGLLGITLQAAEKPEGVLNHTVKNIEGKEVKLTEYQGKVVLVVNVASKCGYTRQYKTLQSLYEKYKDKGLVVLGFPCNQFGKQEPGDEAAIMEFCSSKYNVTFPMFSKIDVNGKNTASFYSALKSQAPGDIQWNFEKFLIGRNGDVIKRFSSKVEPDGQELVSAVEAALGK